MSDELDDRENWAMTCWYTGEDCPCCENAILATNGHTVWCAWCGYSRKHERAALDSQDHSDWEGEA